MSTTCLICCQQSQFFLLPPCNHKQMCWKCCIKLIQGSTFTCPYCNGTPEGTSCILFVDEKEMETFTFQQIMKKSPFKSAIKSYQFYSNETVAKFIEQQTSFFCRLCEAVFNNINILKKHLNQAHRKQFCSVCLQNRKCLLQEQYLYSEGQLVCHMKKGEYSSQNQLMMYHPYCDFCKQRFYDLDAFRAHLRMSSHLKCQICQQNFTKFKYVYYKDYQQIEKHFYKSHFVCEAGNCLGNKLQNVFASQALLEQHKNRVHTKGGKAAQKQVMNILLFDQKAQQQLEWDRIGRDFSKQFAVAEKPVILKNQEHRDSIIDIRPFYPNEISTYHRMGLQQIKQKLFEHLQRHDFKSEVINFTSVPIFFPLEMSSFNRAELEKFLRDVFDYKFSEPIIEIFFTRKFDYRSQNEYFNEIKRRMWTFSPISYYYVFPQLIRYFKDSNKTKTTMDTFYSQSLRNLRINRVFIFHKKQHYTDILNILHEQIEQYIYNLMMEQKIQIDIYAKYLTDMNPELYLKHHPIIFYVQKQKVKNLYHMIQKTKVNQLLKMNWLLKLGLSGQSHKAIFDKFYYRTIDDCKQWLSLISLQELALIYSYVQICLQSIIDKNTYTVNKQNSQALFLGTVLSKIKTCISSKQLTSLKHIQHKSIELAAKLNSFMITSKKKGVVINQQEHPSLLSNNQNNKKVEEKIVVFGQQLNITNIGSNYKTKKTTNSNINRANGNSRVKQQEREQFPELFQSKNKGKETQSKEEDQFPVFNFKQKEAIPNKKQKINKFQEEDNRTNIQKYGLFNPKNDFISQKITQQYYQKKEEAKIETSSKNQTKNNSWDDWPTLKQQTEKQPKQSQVENKKNAKKKKNVNKQQPISADKEQQETKDCIPEQLVIKKKTKQELRAEEENMSKKTKGKKGKYQQKQKQVESKNQGQAEQSKEQKQEKKKRKVRLDATDSEEEQRKKQEEKKTERQNRHKKFLQEQNLKQSLKYHEGFESLLQQRKQAEQVKERNAGSVSIINSLIENSRQQKVQPQIVVKKGKKGKAVIIEKVDIWKL